jgi:hypothetical protein
MIPRHLGFVKGLHLPPLLGYTRRSRSPGSADRATTLMRSETRLECVIRRKAASDSDAIRPPIPTEVDHPFRSKPATLLRPA